MPVEGIASYNDFAQRTEVIAAALEAGTFADPANAALYAQVLETAQDRKAKLLGEVLGEAETAVAAIRELDVLAGLADPEVLAAYQQPHTATAREVAAFIEAHKLAERSERARALLKQIQGASAGAMATGQAVTIEQPKADTTTQSPTEAELETSADSAPKTIEAVATAIEPASSAAAEEAVIYDHEAPLEPDVVDVEARLAKLLADPNFDASAAITPRRLWGELYSEGPVPSIPRFAKLRTAALELADAEPGLIRANGRRGTGAAYIVDMAARARLVRTRRPAAEPADTPPTDAVHDAASQPNAKDEVADPELLSRALSDEPEESGAAAADTPAERPRLPREKRIDIAAELGLKTIGSRTLTVSRKKYPWLDEGQTDIPLAILERAGTGTKFAVGSLIRKSERVREIAVADLEGHTDDDRDLLNDKTLRAVMLMCTGDRSRITRVEDSNILRIEGGRSEARAFVIDAGLDSEGVRIFLKVGVSMNLNSRKRLLRVLLGRPPRRP